MHRDVKPQNLILAEDSKKLKVGGLLLAPHCVKWCASSPAQPCADPAHGKPAGVCVRLLAFASVAKLKIRHGPHIHPPMAQIIDLGACADLRSGTNYVPEETILDLNYCPPEQVCMEGEPEAWAWEPETTPLPAAAVHACVPAPLWDPTRYACHACAVRAAHRLAALGQLHAPFGNLANAVGQSQA